MGVPKSELPRGRPDGDRWAIRHLPFYGGWFRFLTFYPGAGLTIERHASTRLRRRRLAVSADERRDRELFAS